MHSFTSLCGRCYSYPYSLLPPSLSFFLFLLLLMVEASCVVGLDSLRKLCKAYKSIFKRWLRRKKQRFSSSTRKYNQQSHNHLHHQKHFDEASEAGACFNGNNDNFRSNNDDGSRNNNNGPSTSSRRLSSLHSQRHRASRSCESIPASLLWSKNGSGCNSFNLPPPQLSRSSSARKSFSSTIMYSSSSSAMLKPQPIEMTVECTLEELCHGCIKKFKIKRDVITPNGEMSQEEEIVTLNVEPGWRTGTKITFESSGNVRAGLYREDVIFSIWEKKHQLFRREGDDLELVLEIPLVKALSGGIIPIPLLGGEEMNVSFEEDIIFPGFEKVISGQGMPIFNDPDKRGDLRIKFLVEFPTYLTDQQRAEVVSILQE
ncbi:uncharacterized protein [Arachis hypogaea]|uniref:uncharacterized protein n=1 Tax=Arachis hypogaea TaxID=3818 RepID=UPI000DEC9757|nr:uncharacterized protein LOC112763899 [Arachis hypogaea]